MKFHLALLASLLATALSQSTVSVFTSDGQVCYVIQRPSTTTAATSAFSSTASTEQPSTTTTELATTSTTEIPTTTTTSIEQSSTTELTTTSTTTASTTTTESSTTTAAAPAPTSCTNAQNSYCGSYNSGCACSVGLDHTTAYCWDSGSCTGCSSNSDCPTGSRCAFDSQNICGDSTGTYCIDNDQECGSGTPPSRSAKRDLERVFSSAGWIINKEQNVDGIAVFSLSHTGTPSIR